MSEGRRERADAVRNRRAILRATEELLAGRRPEQISMEQIAAAAGVGKGTVFHRFGSRTGLMLALMRERALDLDEAVRSGPPPLGPGAPARERLYAFLDAVVEVVGRNKSLLAELDHAAGTAAPSTGEAPPTAHPVYLGWHAHLSALLAELRPDLDTELVAHLLLGSLQSNPLLRLLEQGEGRRIAGTLRDVAGALVDR
ncbi:TetR/AcrR family transcriptional regulator [Kitasatospora sp. SUK 42]|uniref:TetR/AcrR family transcriptional regulator n=1 Tax=Kitasatospora sp. SUK 42 TaxID=1588882 RepID=UPI0018C97E97|nr:TetR/AcrR family transcriptional regulator [Kitasatospora sp. SUK 42]MBV2155367.1 TetR/AcrR family transcriptional regulator [Kitasatospora sp. SUK 42]